MNLEYLNDNNKVFLQGEVNTDLTFSHELKGDKFFTFDLKVPRSSGTYDFLPILVSEKLLAVNKPQKGERIALKGQFRSHNEAVNNGEKTKLILAVYCKEFCELDNELNPNIVELNGYICKPPIYRTTPFGRQITDVLIAVNRNFNKSDYIPCIAWGQNAIYTSSLNVGTPISIMGRIQSREYNKYIEGQELPVQKIAYEVSINKLDNYENEVL